MVAFCTDLTETVCIGRQRRADLNIRYVHLKMEAIEMNWVFKSVNRVLKNRENIAKVNITLTNKLNQNK